MTTPNTFNWTAEQHEAAAAALGWQAATMAIIAAQFIPGSDFGNGMSDQMAHTARELAIDAASHAHAAAFAQDAIGAALEARQ